MNLDKLHQIILDKKKTMPEGSYTASLLKKDSNRVIQKFGEEAVEVIIAAKDNNKQEIISESGDMLYHFLVMLAKLEIDLSDIVKELENRMEGKDKIGLQLKKEK